ncbi:hypothetical protein JTE90_002962 [Oedothorax gibbosus]|uniref:Uncharacterized protein n=1 Tax=Oedothorax gibbosus TaxID=931172 RepID=A0AAV6VHY7_9ARAC|nr:hypothetical protein JTE90_002962 [Oedothorax gibbosus]
MNVATVEDDMADIFNDEYADALLDGVVILCRFQRKILFCCIPASEGFEYAPLFQGEEEMEGLDNTLDPDISFEALDGLVETLVHQPF